LAESSSISRTLETHYSGNDNARSATTTLDVTMAHGDRDRIFLTSEPPRLVIV
jgi:hypothetical protein